MKRTRRNRSAAYKAKGALAALKEDKTPAELTQQFDVHVNQITQWKGQLLERASDVFATAAAQIGLIQLEADPNRRSKYVDFIDYYADLSDEEQARYRATHVNEQSQILRHQLSRRFGARGCWVGEFMNCPYGPTAFSTPSRWRRFSPKAEAEPRGHRYGGWSSCSGSRQQRCRSLAGERQ
jgi:transposase-like protein